MGSTWASARRKKERFRKEKESFFFIRQGHADKWFHPTWLRFFRMWISFHFHFLLHWISFHFNLSFISPLSIHSSLSLSLGVSASKPARSINLPEISSRWVSASQANVFFTQFGAVVFDSVIDAMLVMICSFVYETKFASLEIDWYAEYFTLSVFFLIIIFLLVIKVFTLSCLDDL